MTRAEIETKAREQVLKTVIAMRRTSNVYAYQLTKLEVVIDWDCDTGWTDGVTLGFNPEWFLSLSVGQARTFFAHEVEHIEQGIPWRMARYPADWWNYINEGADYGVNARLVAAGYEPIPGWLLDEQYANRSAEDIAAELYKNDHSPEPEDDETAGKSETNDDTNEDDSEGTQQPHDDGDENSEGGESGGKGAEGDEDESDGAEASGGVEGDESEGGEGGGDEASSPNDDSDCGNKVAKGNSATGGVRPYPTSEDDERGEEEQLRDGYQSMREDMANGVRYAEANGGLSEADRIKYQELLDPEVNYAEILRDLVDEVFPDDYSYDHPERDLFLRKFYAPSLYNEKPKLAAFVVDTSGSMDMEAFAQASGDVKSICDDLNVDLLVVYCDSRVRGTQYISAGQSEELAPVGGGGTAFTPAFEFLEDLDEPASVILYFTDMKCNRYKFPKNEPSTPTYFVQWDAIDPDTGRRVRFDHPDLPPWATVVRMEGGNR